MLIIIFIHPGRETRLDHVTAAAALLFFSVLGKTAAGRAGTSTTTPLIAYGRIWRRFLHNIICLTTGVAGPRDNNNNNKTTGRHIRVYTSVHMYMYMIYTLYSYYSGASVQPPHPWWLYAAAAESFSVNIFSPFFNKTPYYYSVQISPPPSSSSFSTKISQYVH